MKTADFLVIGGGIAGISAAAHLSEHGLAIVLEAEPIVGYHATGRSAAVFIRNYGNDVLRALNAASQSYLEDGGLLRKRGELLLALPSQDHLISQHLKRGDTVARLDESEIQELLPILRPGRFCGGAYETDAFDIDVDRLLQGYVRQVKANGSRIETNKAVTSLTRSDGVWQLTAAGDRYAAPVVINAAGAWADQVAQLAGLRQMGLQPLRRSAAIIPTPDHDLTDWPLFVGIEEDWYAKPEAGQLMVSPADEIPVDPHDAYPDDIVLAEGIDRFEQATTLQVKRVTHSWAGLRTFAPDRSPVVGFDAATEGFFWLAGQGGYGVQTAPALSALAADMCIGQTPKIAAEICARLAPTRF